MASQYSARLGVLLSLNTAEFSKSVDAAIQENRKLKSAMQREMKSAAKEVQALEYAVKDYGREVSNVEKMQRNFAEGGKFQQLGKASDEFRQKMLAQAAAMDVQVNKFRAGQKALHTGFQMTAQQMAALGYQSTDIVTGLISGQSPFMVLIQQGGQLRDQFGGFANVFKGFASVITLSRVAMAGLAGGIAAVGYAFIKGSSDAQKFSDTLLLINNTSQLTYARFSLLAYTVSDRFNSSISDAKVILGELASSGDFAGQHLEDVGIVIARVTQLTGESASAVAKRLIPSLDGSAKGAAELNKQFHFLTLSEYKQIETLEKLGRKTEALSLISSKFIQTQDSHKRELGTIQRAWESIVRLVDEYKNRWLDIGKPSSEINDIYEEIANLEDKGFNWGNLFKSEKEKQDRINELKIRAMKLMDEYVNKQIKANQQRKDDAAIANLEKERALAKNRRDLNDETSRLKVATALSAEELIQTESILISRRGDQRKFEIAKKYNNMIADDKLATGGRLGKQIESQRAAAVKASDQQELVERDKLEKKRADIASDAAYLLQVEQLEIKAATADAFLLIDLEYEKKALDAWRERDKLQRDENGSYRPEREAAFRAQIQLWERERERKKAQISRQAALEIANEQQGRLNNIEIQRAEIQLYAENLLAGEKDIAVLKAKLVYTQEIAKIEANAKLLPADREAAKERAAGIRDASIALAKESEQLQYLQDMNAAVFKNMESAIENFVKTGKLNFKDLTRSIIADLMAVYLKAQILSGLRTVFAGTPIASFFAPGKADGGPVSGGTQYMVGERGPELFVPSSSGTIIPNHRLASNDGGPQIIYNGPYIASMSAIDTQSASQFLAKNKAAVWAANQSAQRSVPAPR